MRVDPINLYDYEARAKQVLPHNNWEFIEAGSMDEITTARNRFAFESLTLRPRFMRDTTERKIATTVLGQDISFPVMIAPTGGHGNAHAEAECATARGAGMSNTLMMCSTSSNCSMEEIADAATGPLWFQLYHRGYDLTEGLVKRAEAAGYRAIVLTVDTPVPSPKERDLRNRYQRPGELGNFRDRQDRLSEISGTDESPTWEMPQSPPLTWQEIDWLRSLTDLPLVLKGVRVAEDARLAVEHGVNGLLVSTHGGRQLDGTMSSIEMVPEIVAAAGGKAEVYVDSGIRRGSDVLKALALGATAVAVGRPLYWGLAVNGADGVHHMLELLREEFNRAMAYCGQNSVDDLEDRLLNIPREWGPFRTENDIADYLPFDRSSPGTLTIDSPSLVSIDTFEALADEWEANGPRGVDIADMVEHTAYQQIIGMGQPAVPWLLGRLERQPNHWFHALNSITGAQPVPPEGEGNFKSMTDSWLDWGRENGYI